MTTAVSEIWAPVELLIAAGTTVTIDVYGRVWRVEKDRVCGTGITVSEAMRKAMADALLPSAACGEVETTLGGHAVRVIVTRPPFTRHTSLTLIP
ncbi:hypothetical protein EPN42_04695 [bacterium]|nr:MAG: hypothetical protein EPN42_04695 [bacterium]